MAAKFAPVGTQPNEYRLVGKIDGSLWLMPNGVYRLDGRVIPVGDDTAISDDHSQLVVGVHRGEDMSVGLLGSQLGVDIK